MADQPDPPDQQPDPPEQWRVYEGDPTPDPEPSGATPPDPPPVPYGGRQDPVIITTSSSTSWVPRLILLIVGIAVVGVVAGIAIVIFAAVDGGIGGIDAKDPDDFADLVDTLEEEKGTTIVQEVGFYTDYIIVYMPYTEDPGDDRQISWTWRGGDDLEKWTTGTSDDARFDLRDIDPDVIDGMCDPVLAEGEGIEEDECYVFLSKPSEGSQAWFRVSASDDFKRSYSVEYDKDGNELSRTCDGQPCTG